jgi:flagellar M-ring protein FliF
MNALQRILQLPARQLAGLAIAVAAVVAMMVGVYVWSETPDYKVLYNNLGDRDGGAVVQALGTLNIPYKFSDGGNAILVPSTMVYDARLKLASQGLPKGGITGMELMENQKFGTTQFQEQVNYQRGLEGELARTIQSVSAVQAARVHLAIPKSSVFLRDAEKPSASVFLNLYPGKALDHAQVEGILHLVSASVPELTADAVSIIDQNGTLLTRDSQSNSGLDPNQLAYVTDLEQSYTHRVLSIIEPITGRANVRAQVTADIDFSQSESTAESYKPNGTPENAAIRSQQTTESNSSSPAGGAPTGIPGAASNQPNTAAAATAAPIPPTPPAEATTAHKDSTTNYELDKTVQVKRAPMGAVRHLSVAIVVNNHKTTDDKGAVSMKPSRSNRSRRWRVKPSVSPRSVAIRSTSSTPPSTRSMSTPPKQCRCGRTQRTSVWPRTPARTFCSGCSVCTWCLDCCVPPSSASASSRCVVRARCSSWKATKRLPDCRNTPKTCRP